MSTKTTTTGIPANSVLPPSGDRELVFSRLIAAPRERVFDAWIKKLPLWWGPYGMTTPTWEMDLRPGGIFRTIMRAPDGREFLTKGVFLEVVRPERIVFTDAYEAGWQPSPGAFFTAVATFEDHNGRTKYTARALHWTIANRQKHERMGFHQGWNESVDRLEALVARL